MENNINRKPEDIAYLAGYIDADGHIGLQHRKKRNHYQPHLTITASRRDILEELKEMAAIGGVIWTGESPPGSGRPVSRLTYSSQQACKLCELVLPYLRLKKVQAQLLVHIGVKRRKHPNGRGYNVEAYYIPRYEAMKRLNAANKADKIR